MWVSHYFLHFCMFGIFHNFLNCNEKQTCSQVLPHEEPKMVPAISAGDGHQPFDHHQSVATDEVMGPMTSEVPFNTKNPNLCDNKTGILDVGKIFTIT